MPIETYFVNFMIPSCGLFLKLIIFAQVFSMKLLPSEELDRWKIIEMKFKVDLSGRKVQNVECDIICGQYFFLKNFFFLDPNISANGNTTWRFAHPTIRIRDSFSSSVCVCVCPSQKPGYFTPFCNPQTWSTSDYLLKLWYFLKTFRFSVKT